MTCPVILIKKIDHFYYDIVNTVYGCIRKCIPMKKHNEHSIVGWNEEVKQYHPRKHW